MGKTVRDEAELIEQRTGSEVTEDWLTSFRDRRNEALSLYLTAILDIHDAVHRVHAHHGGRIACASGADRFKVELMLRKLELISYFDGRIFSGYETPRPNRFRMFTWLPRLRWVLIPGAARWWKTPSLA